MTKLVGESFGELAEILRDIAVASMPFLVDGLQKVRDFLAGISDKTKNIGGLRDSIGGLVDHLKAWLQLGKAVGELMVALFGGETAKAGQSMVEWMTQGAEALAEWARSAGGQKRIGEFFKEMAPWIKEFVILLGQVGVILLQVFQFFAPLMTAVLAGINAVLGATRTFLDWLIKVDRALTLANVGNAIASAWDAVVSVVTGAADAIAAAVVGGVSAAIGAISGAGATPRPPPRPLREGARRDQRCQGVGRNRRGNVVSFAIGKITGAFDWALNAGRNLFQKVKGGINAAQSAVAGAALDVVNGAIDKITGAFDRALNAGKNLFEKVKGGINSAFGAVAGVAGDIVNAVIDKVTGAFDNARNAGENLFNKVKGGISDAAEAVKAAAATAVQGAVGKVGDFADAFYSAGVSLIQNMIDGFKSKVADLLSTIKDAASKAADLLPGSEPKDPTSPLRGLPERGRALIGNFARGIEEAAPDLARVMADGLSVAVAPPQMALPAGVGSSRTSKTVKNYDVTLQSPAGTIADPGIALALLDAELRARGGVG